MDQSSNSPIEDTMMLHRHNNLEEAEVAPRDSMIDQESKVVKEHLEMVEVLTEVLEEVEWWTENLIENHSMVVEEEEV